MGSNWQSVDSNFPTFTEDESPYAQIQKLTDYMYQLTESLKYSLNNLDTDNWNSTRLEQFSVELTGDLEKDLTAYGEAFTRLQGVVSSLSAKVAAQEQQVAKIKDLEDRVTQIEKTAQNQAQTLEQLSKANTKQGNMLTQLQEAVSTLCLWFVPQEDVLRIGYEGARVDVVGDVYINGAQEV